MSLRSSLSTSRTTSSPFPVPTTSVRLVPATASPAPSSTTWLLAFPRGFEKKLELAGVGYRVQQKGKNLEFSLGFSHPVIVEAPEGITFEVPDNTHVNVKGINKEQVGPDRR